MFHMKHFRLQKIGKRKVNFSNFRQKLQNFIQPTECEKTVKFK